MELSALIRTGRLNKNMSQQEVADAVNVSKQAISQYENGHSEPKEETKKLLYSLLDLSIVSQVLKEPTVEYKRTPRGVPYYDIDVTAGNVEIFKGESEEQPKEYFYIPAFNDCTAYVNVRGDSMYSKYNSGDIIAIKQINDREIIQFGEAYVIITEEQNLLKYIRKHQDHDKWLLESEYKDRYDTFPINKDKVLNIFLVRGLLRQKTM